MKSASVLAAESKSHFAAGDFKTASLLLAEIRESDPFNNYVQMGDGAVHVVQKGDDGKSLTDKHGELVTKAVE